MAIVGLAVVAGAVVVFFAVGSGGDDRHRSHEGVGEGLQAPKGDTQRSLIKEYVLEGYVDWARHNPTKACPASLQEVADEMGRKDTKDAWGRELHMACGGNLPAGATKDGFAVWSLGADPNDPTDDIKSWQ